MEAIGRLRFTFVNSAELVDRYAVRYERVTGWARDLGFATFARRGGVINVMHEDFSLPSPVDEIEVQPLDEPVFPYLPPQQHVQVGILGVVPAGTKLATGGEVHELEHPATLLIYPLGDVDTKLAIPRTPVLPHEATVKAAVQGVQRQTGIVMRPVLHLGDFPTGPSICRLYMGRIVGGNPFAKREIGEGTDAMSRVVTQPPGSV